MAALLRIKERMKNFILDPIIHEIAKLMFSLTQKGKRIKFLWIPAHSGIVGNSQADKLARIASSINIGINIYPLQEDLLNLF